MVKALPKKGVRDPKIRVVMARFTESEYRKVLMASASSRSLSDYLRIAVLADVESKETRNNA